MLTEIIFGILASFVGLAAILALNIHRHRQKKIWSLRPNCLMTRYPLVFLTGRRSLFYFLSYWNDIPDYLAQHGFQVQILSLNWNNTRIRTFQIETYLDAKSKARERFHLFVDASSLREIIFLLQRRDFECLESITLIGSESLIPPYRLRVPIYSLEMKKNSLRRKDSFSLVWQIHSLLTSQTSRRSLVTGLAQCGWQLDPQDGYSLLERVQTLAESDLLKNRSFFNLET